MTIHWDLAGVLRRLSLHADGVATAVVLVPLLLKAGAPAVARFDRASFAKEAAQQPARSSVKPTRSGSPCARRTIGGIDSFSRRATERPRWRASSSPRCVPAGASAEEPINGCGIGEWFDWAEQRAAALDPTGQPINLESCRSLMRMKSAYPSSRW